MTRQSLRRHRSVASLRRAASLTALALVTPLLVAPWGASASPSPVTMDHAAGPLVKQPTPVTLITGDTVTVRPDSTPTVEAAPGRGRITFDIQALGDELRVVPSDAEPLIASGRLDERLFDLSYLVTEGYDDASQDALPLLVQGNQSDVRALAAAPGASVMAAHPAGQFTVLAQERSGRDRTELWSELVGATSGPMTMRAAASVWPDGVRKVWLDGTVHASLDKSVPQIGAPEVWQQGYDGSGVTVAVLDTGIDTTHPDLQGKVVKQKVFSTSPLGGTWNVAGLDHQVGYVAIVGGSTMPKTGTSAPLVDVGRACTKTLGDRLLADPAGKVAMVTRGNDACPIAEQYDALVEAGATGLVVYNDQPGLFTGLALEATHRNSIWSATISDADGAALGGLLRDGEVRIGFSADGYAGDLVGHGTHVAGTIAGSGAASGGKYRGVAPGASIMNGKVLDDNGKARESWVMAGMQWAATNGADIISMSLGGDPSDGSDPMSQLVNQLTEQDDVLFVIAAGNEGDMGQTVGSPGVADDALTVGAVDKSDQLAPFSSTGLRRGDFAVKPNVTAPGVDIVAPRAAGTSMLGNVTPLDDHYMPASGTSMATPHVAGAAALLLQAHPNLHARGLKDALASTAVDNGYTTRQQGTGRIDVARAVSQDMYADSDLTFGSLTGIDAPVTRQLTYTNDTDAAVQLRITAEPKAAVSLSTSQLSVPADGTASVEVTLDPARLDLGGDGGAVVATGDQISLRTGLGFNRARTIDPMTSTWAADWSKDYEFSDTTAGVRLGDAAISPDGRELFQFGPAFLSDEFVTAAIDSSTGEPIWVAHHPVVDGSGTYGAGVAVSPDGGTVFVSGEETDPATNRTSVVTIAYNNRPPKTSGDPRLGDELWRAVRPSVSISGVNPGGGGAIAVSPDGGLVLLTTTEYGAGNSSAMTTIAYDADTGDRKWIATHAEPGLRSTGLDLVVDPAGQTAYVTGFTQIRANEVPANPLTVAYSLTGDGAGQEKWVSRQDSVAVNFQGWGNSVSEDGKRVFVTSTAMQDGEDFDERLQTAALDAATGKLLWSATFGAAGQDGWLPGHTGPSRGLDQNATNSIAVSPDNRLMFVSGSHCEGPSCSGDFALVTVAYDQRTGEKVWSDVNAVVNPPLPRTLDASIAVSPDGNDVYVSGVCCAARNTVLPRDQVTLTYDAGTGRRTAVARENYTGRSSQQADKILVDPVDGRVFTVGDARFSLTSQKPTAWITSAYTPTVTFSSLRLQVQRSRQLGWITEAGSAQLIAALRQAEKRALDSPARAAESLEGFRRIAEDKKWVPVVDARDSLSGNVTQLIGRLR